MILALRANQDYKTFCTCAACACVLFLYSFHTLLAWVLRVVVNKIHGQFVRYMHASHTIVNGKCFSVPRQIIQPPRPIVTANRNPQFNILFLIKCGLLFSHTKNKQNDYKRQSFDWFCLNFGKFYDTQRNPRIQ